MSVTPEFVFDGTETRRQAKFAGDDKLFVRFYPRAVMNKVKSAEEGRPIFDQKDYITIMVPGDKNSVIDTQVDEGHMRRFASRYENYKKQNETVEVGTPLEIVPWLTVNLVAELKAMGIHTVENLAELSDGHAQKFAGFSHLRERAMSFLDAAAGEASNTKLAKELEDRDARIASLEEQMKQMMDAQVNTKSG